MAVMTVPEISALLVSPRFGLSALDANTVATFVHPLLTAGQTGAQIATALQAVPPAGLGVPAHQANALGPALYSEWIRGPAGAQGPAGAPGRNAPWWQLGILAAFVIGACVVGSIALVNGFTIDGNAQIRESEINETAVNADGKATLAKTTADATKTDLAAVKADLATTKTELAGIKTNAAAAMAKATTVETTVAGLTTKLVTHGQRLDDLTLAVNGHTAELAALTTTVNGKADASAVASLEGSVKRYRWQVKSLTTQVAKLTAPKVEQKPAPQPAAAQPAPQARLHMRIDK